MNGKTYKKAVNEELGTKRVVSVTGDRRPRGTVWYVVVDVAGMETDDGAAAFVEAVYETMKRHTGGCTVSTKSRGMTRETARRVNVMMA